MRAPPVLTPSSLVLSAALLAALQLAAPAAADPPASRPAAPAAVDPGLPGLSGLPELTPASKPTAAAAAPGSLPAREQLLRRVDTAGVAAAELRAARTLFVLADWLGKEGAQERRRRALRLAGLKLGLAERLIKVNQLTAEVKRLQRALKRARGSIVKTKQTIEQRKAYLHVLRSSR